jgi:hypothetical protein
MLIQKLVCNIASGKRNNRTGTTAEYDEFLAPLEGQPTTTRISTISEIQELFRSVSDRVSNLFRLSSLIRTASTRDRYSRAAATDIVPFDDQYDIAHVQHKFPRLDTKENQWLSLRLGKAITWRRQYLRYAREHQTKLSLMKFNLDTADEPTNLGELTSHPNAAAQSLLAPSVVPSHLAPPTTASTLIVNRMEVPQAQPEDSKSQISFATVVNEGSVPSINQIMSLENASEGREDFVCPYCGSFQRHTKETSWRYHHTFLT